MDAEDKIQNDLAKHLGGIPAIAFSNTIFGRGGYLTWALSRFRGIANWCSTLIGRLPEDPAKVTQIQDIIGPVNNCEVDNVASIMPAAKTSPRSGWSAAAIARKMVA